MTMKNLPDVTSGGLIRRKECWQAGQDWCLAEHLVQRAMAATADRSPYDQHLFFDGIAHALIAAGRDIAKIDEMGRR